MIDLGLQATIINSFHRRGRVWIDITEIMSINRVTISVTRLTPCCGCPTETNCAGLKGDSLYCIDEKWIEDDGG